MRLALLVPIALLAANVLAPAAAEHSVSPCSEIVTIGTGEASLYLVRDLKDELWLYVESNGHPGLQQGGTAWYEVGTGWRDRPCWDRDLATGEEILDPDTIVL